MAYATTIELRARINKTGVADDATLLALLEAASDAIDRITNHHLDGVAAFGASAVATAREYAGSGQAYQWIDECVAVTLVEVKEAVTDTAYTAWAAADWRAFTGAARHPNFNALPYTGIMCAPAGSYAYFLSGEFAALDAYFPNNLAMLPREGGNGIAAPTVRITANWGVTASPPDIIREAAIMLAARWWKRMESAMSDTLASGELGQLLYTQPIDPDVKMLLMNSRYYRPQVARRF